MNYQYHLRFLQQKSFAHINPSNMNYFISLHIVSYFLFYNSPKSFLWFHFIFGFHLSHHTFLCINSEYSFSLSHSAHSGLRVFPCLYTVCSSVYLSVPPYIPLLFALWPTNFYGSCSYLVQSLTFLPFEIIWVRTDWCLGPEILIALQPIIFNRSCSYLVQPLTSTAAWHVHT